MSGSESVKTGTAVFGLVVLSFLGYTTVIMQADIDKLKAKNEALQRLHLSEHKESVLSYDAREAKFQETIVPSLNLKPGSLDYKVLQNVCVDGVYGSKPKDWDVDANKVETVYDACGWKVTTGTDKRH